MKSCNQLSKWWEQSLGGDVKAFSCIHNELYSDLYYYLFKIVKDQDAARDILQDLFIKLWERKEKLGIINNVKYYFLKTARSQAINFLKETRPEMLDMQNQQDIDIVFSIEDLMVNREVSLEIQKLLAVALNDLPQRQKEIIFLKYFDDLDYDRIAEVTGLQYQSVVNHVHRGITQLRTAFTGKSFKLRELSVY